MTASDSRPPMTLRCRCVDGDVILEIFQDLDMSDYFELVAGLKRCRSADAILETLEHFVDKSNVRLRTALSSRKKAG